MGVGANRHSDTSSSAASQRAEQPGRDVARRGGPVQVGEPAGAVGVGVVRRQAGLVEQLPVDVVQGGDAAADLGGQPRTRRQVGQLQRTPGQVGVDRSPATLLERDEPLGGGHREGQPPGQEPEQGHRDVHPGSGCARHRRAHHPPAVLGVLDEGQLELLPGVGLDRLDGRRVQSGNGRAGQGGEGKSTAGHPDTVCPSRRLGWKA